MLVLRKEENSVGNSPEENRHNAACLPGLILVVPSTIISCSSLSTVLLLLHPESEILLLVHFTIVNGVQFIQLSAGSAAVLEAAFCSSPVNMSFSK